MGSVTDDRGRRLSLRSPPSRIVSLVPSDTYTLARLGLASRLVGRTRYCVAPPGQLADVAVVGGVLDPDVPRIVALRPDLVVANREDNRRSDVERLEAQGLAVLVSDPRTVRAGLDHARRLWQLCVGAGDAPPPALDQAATRLARTGPPRDEPLPAFVPIWRRPLLAVGPGSHADDVLGQVGAANVVTALVVGRDVHRGRPAERYPRVDLDAVAAAGPALLLLPDEPYDFTDGDAAELARALSPIRGDPRPRVRRCSGRHLFWYGLGALEGLSPLGRLVAEARVEISTPLCR